MVIVVVPVSSPSRLYLLSLFSILIISTFPLISNAQQSDYLKLPLVHRNPFPTPFDSLSADNNRLSNLFSALALHRNKIPKLPLTSGASTGSGQYFVNLKIGTPPQTLLLVADTGSDLVWVRCSACRNCTSRAPNSAFLARHSSTFSPHHCYDSACQLIPNPRHSHCNHTRLHSPCRYEYSYSDGSFTTGFFSKDTSTFNTTSTHTLNHNTLTFGCGFHISGPSVSGPSFNGAQGVLGLGRGPISLVSQLSVKFGNKFSYCLMDYTLSPPPTSFLLIGGGDKNGVVFRSYTPLLNNSLSPTFYYIGIQSIYVNNVKLRISPSVWAIDGLGNGGTVIDSGTTLTFLPDPAYRRVVGAFKRRVTLPSPTVSTPGFDLCVNVSGVSKLILPKLRFKLSGGALLSPPSGNYFIDTADGVKCLALQPVTSPAGFSVIGNLMQQGYLFEFDSDRSRLGFTRRGCSLPLP